MSFCESKSNSIRDQANDRHVREGVRTQAGLQMRLSGDCSLCRTLIVLLGCKAQGVSKTPMEPMSTVPLERS